MIASTRTVALLAGLAFVSGGIAGAIIDHKYACRECRGPKTPTFNRAGPTWAEDQARGWTRALDLDGEQRRKVEALIADVKPAFDRAYQATRAQRREVDRQFRTRLREVLTDVQRERMEAFAAAEERRRREYYGVGSKPAIGVDVEAFQPPFGEDESAGENASQ